MKFLNAVFVLQSAVSIFILSTPAFGQGSSTQIKLSFNDLISNWTVSVSGESRQRSLQIFDLKEISSGVFSIDAMYGWADGSPAKINGSVTQINSERQIEIITPTDSKINARQTTDDSFKGTIIYKSGVSKTVTIVKESTGLKGAADITEKEVSEKPAATSAAQKVTPQVTNIGAIPFSVQEYSSNEYDGNWSGRGIVTNGNCNTPTVKFSVQGARIFSAKNSSYFGYGFSNVVGVIHEDKTVDIVLFDSSARGRVNVAKGKILGKEIKIADLGNSCSYEYTMSR